MKKVAFIIPPTVELLDLANVEITILIVETSKLKSLIIMELPFKPIPIRQTHHTISLFFKVTKIDES